MYHRNRKQQSNTLRKHYDRELEERIANNVIHKLVSSLSTHIQSKSQNEPEYYTPKQVEQIFYIKQKTVCSWVRSGKIDGISGRPTLINAKSLRQYLTDRNPNYISNVCHTGDYPKKKGVVDDL